MNTIGLKAFICYRSKDKIIGNEIIKRLTDSSCNIEIEREVENTNGWKKNVLIKYLNSEIVIFLIDKITFNSENLIWEYNTALGLKKRLYGIKLEENELLSLTDKKDIMIFKNTTEFIQYLKDKL